MRWSFYVGTFVYTYFCNFRLQIYKFHQINQNFIWISQLVKTFLHTCTGDTYSMDSPWIGWFFEKFHLVLSYNVFKLQFKLILSRIYTKRKFSIFRSTILWVSLRDFIMAAQENGLYHILQILGKWFCRQSLHFPKIKFRSEKMVSRNLDLSVFSVRDPICL